MNSINSINNCSINNCYIQNCEIKNCSINNEKNKKDEIEQIKQINKNPYPIRDYIQSSRYQTKLWRLRSNWYKDGRRNECEKYQISFLEKITKQKMYKTYDRINIENCKILRNIHLFSKTVFVKRKLKSINDCDIHPKMIHIL